MSFTVHLCGEPALLGASHSCLTPKGARPRSLTLTDGEPRHRASLTPHRGHNCDMTKQHLDTGHLTPHQPRCPRCLDVQSLGPDD